MQKLRRGLAIYTILLELLDRKPDTEPAAKPPPAGVEAEGDAAAEYAEPAAAAIRVLVRVGRGMRQSFGS